MCVCVRHGYLVDSVCAVKDEHGLFMALATVEFEVNTTTWCAEAKKWLETAKETWQRDPSAKQHLPFHLQGKQLFTERKVDKWRGEMRAPVRPARVLGLMFVMFVMFVIFDVILGCFAFWCTQLDIPMETHCSLGRSNGILSLVHAMYYGLLEEDPTRTVERLWSRSAEPCSLQLGSEFFWQAPYTKHWTRGFKRTSVERARQARLDAREDGATWKALSIPQLLRQVREPAYASGNYDAHIQARGYRVAVQELFLASDYSAGGTGADGLLHACLRCEWAVEQSVKSNSAAPYKRQELSRLAPRYMALYYQREVRRVLYIRCRRLTCARLVQGQTPSYETARMMGCIFTDTQMEARTTLTCQR